MKHKIALLAMVSLLLAGQADAQTHTNKEKSNYFVLTRNVAQLKPILLAAEALAKEGGSKFGEFQVVICGKAVRDLVNEKTMVPLLKMAHDRKVTLLACGFSLQKFDVKSAELPSGIGVIENGILYGLQLQKEGYYSITL
ncbi:sulfur reduction protein DsrE [Echinicola soli]|uniref:Sulfur reduction protein DsrE n=1 Tax=Echinicola soli TaxID=2591634 RepID=A0A514CME2_9BACT|nr:DsrE family protein [Echinicola soli]QDH80986.1 sulfur reduction protein DsrE [Echinicola soli]